MVSGISRWCATGGTWKLCGTVVQMSVITVLLMAIGCSGGPTATPSGNTNGDATDSGSETIRLAFVTNQIANFWNIAEVGAKDAGNDLSAPGSEVEVEVRFPDPGQASVQKQIVEDLIASGIQGLAISPVDKELVPTINNWAEQVDLITHDSDSPESNRLMYIGMDNYKAGRMAGELLVNALPDGGQVGIFVGRLEQDNALKRRQGLIDVLMGVDQFNGSYSPADAELKNDKYEIVGTFLDQGKSDVALSKAEDALSKYSDMKAVVGLFEYNPPELIKAVEKRGKLGEIVIVGFDENDLTLQGIKEGTVAGTIVQNPYEYGYQSIKVLTALARGDQSVIPESKYIDVPPRKITAENVDNFWDEKKSLLSQ